MRYKFNTSNFQAALCLLFQLLLLTLLYSCAEAEHDAPSAQGSLHTVSIELEVPGLEAPDSETPDSAASDPAASDPEISTRLSADDQNDINEIYVICFDSSSKKYIAHYQVNQGITVSTGTGSFKLSLPKGTYDMMFVANPGTTLSTAINSLTTSDTFDSAPAKLVLTQSACWPLKSLGQTDWELPMYGQKKSVPITTNSSITGITMRRMHATIDVQVKDGVTFTLQSVAVYRYSTKGALVPGTTDPTQPAGNYTPSGSSLSYSGSNYIKSNAIKNAIFLMEAPAGSASTPGTNICLVIGGKANGSSTTTYYRVDLAKVASGANTTEETPVTYTYFALARNTRYVVQMSRVLGPGYATAALALTGTPFTAFTTIFSHDTNERMLDMVYDDDHYLGTSHKTINLSYGGYPFVLTTAKHGIDATYQQKIYVSTNHTSNVTWSTDASSWLGVASASGTDYTSHSLPGLPTSIKLKGEYQLRVNPNSGTSARTGTIKLTAGKLTKTITVTQAADTRSITPIFRVNNTQRSAGYQTLYVSADGARPAAQQIDVEWGKALSLGITGAIATNLPIGNGDITHEFPPEALALDPTTKTKAYGEAAHGGWGRIRLLVQPAAPNSKAEPWKSNLWMQRCSKVTITASASSTYFYARQVMAHVELSTDQTISFDVDKLKYNAPSPVTIMYNVPISVGALTNTLRPGISGTYWKNTLVTMTTPTASPPTSYVRTSVTASPTLSTAVTAVDAPLYAGYEYSFPVTCSSYSSVSATHTLTPGYPDCGTTESAIYQVAGTDRMPVKAVLTKATDGNCMMVDAWRTTAVEYYAYPASDPTFWGYTHADAMNACPDGWRPPTYDEMKVAFESSDLVRSAMQSRHSYNIVRCACGLVVTHICGADFHLTNPDTNGIPALAVQHSNLSNSWAVTPYPKRVRFHTHLLHSWFEDGFVGLPNLYVTTLESLGNYKYNVKHPGTVIDVRHARLRQDHESSGPPLLTPRESYIEYYTDKNGTKQRTAAPKAGRTGHYCGQFDKTSGTNGTINWTYAWIDGTLVDHWDWDHANAWDRYAHSQLIGTVRCVKQ